MSALIARLRKAASRLWDSGAALGEFAGGAAALPLRLRPPAPAPAGLLDAAADLDADLQALRALAHSGVIAVHWQTRHYRRSGALQWPAEIVVADVPALAQLLGREADLERFAQLLRAVQARLPAAQAWLARQPLAALAAAPELPRLLEVAASLRASPRPGCHARALDVAGVDSKFIETHRSLLAGLLDSVLPLTAIDWCAPPGSARGFARRYGLAGPPRRVRLRILDPALAPHPGLDDLELPMATLARWPIDCRHVLITENQVNGLSLPPTPGSIVIFGLGHALRELDQVPWLRARALHYWGDLDTHGFAMLSALRRRFPQTRSWLMDEATLLAHRALWGQEEAQQRWLQPLAHLEPAEAEVFAGLVGDRWAPALRLEQERIGFGWMRAALELLVAET